MAIDWGLVAQAILITVFLVFVVPFLIFQYVKMGTVAVLRGREIFHKMKEKKDQDNGTNTPQS